MHIHHFFRSLFDLFYPNLCACCGKTLLRGEECLCSLCLHDLPRTYFTDFQNNEAAQRFWGKVRTERVTAFYFFSKGTTFRQLLHKFKYHGEKEIGLYLGKIIAQKLVKEQFMEGIDLIIPVPLHPRKEHKRGYNQSEWIAKGLSEVSKIPYSTKHVKRVIDNDTQTNKNTYERHQNTLGIFESLKPNLLQGKHILLVDDVLTTGSTLEACAHAFHSIPDIKISIFALSILNG
ncbi:MAG: ComF family protein [Paludibacteraceae bacterium]|nr:ComF family protein [Paludibacteraceae bacterium]